jgi:hypothetical protein
VPGVAVRVVNATAERDGSSFGLCGAHVRGCLCAGPNRGGAPLSKNEATDINRDVVPGRKAVGLWGELFNGWMLANQRSFRNFP